MSQLVGWDHVPIGNLCSLNNGRAFKPMEWSNKGLPIVRIQNLNDREAKFNHYSGEFDDRYYLRGGELLFAWSGTPGTSFGAHIWCGREALLNQHIFRVDFDERAIEKRFFRYAINQKLDELIGKAHGGVGLRHVTRGKFEQTEIALPPRNEQTRIADKIDSLLANGYGCRERLDRVPQILKKFREAVLEAAVSGKLTEEWRRGAPSHWQSVVLGDLFRAKPRNGYSPKSVEYSTHVMSLTLTATTSGRFRGEHFKYIDEAIPVDSHLWLNPGDILIQRANTIEYVGVSALYDGQPGRYIYPDLMMKCQANARVSTEYLHVLLQSASVRSYFREHATGTAGNMPKINQQTVMAPPVMLPPRDEQAEIVRRVQELFSNAGSLQRRYDVALDFLEKLAPSILAKAFRGELVPQDPND